MPGPVSLVSAFDGLPDPRRSQGLDHRLPGLLVIAVGTLRVGGESAYEMEDFGRVEERLSLNMRELCLQLNQHLLQHLRG